MNCAKCHTPLPADAAFCPNCGTKPGAAASGGLKTFSGRGTIAPIRESRGSVLEPGTKFAGRYEVVRKLGEGGMGVVYVARDPNTNEEIVLKLIHPELVTGEAAIKRLLAEGITARQIRHPNIVAVYDVAQWEGQPYFTMEYVKGGTLRSWMVNHFSAGIIKTMLAGLGEAHRMGVVHRDLKPENVLLCGDPDTGDFNLKILDFGIAKAIDAPVSGSGGAIGTPLYMAPEQMTSAESVGPMADIYSLSVIFYELLMEASPQARWEPVSKNRPDVPPAIDALIEKGLSARPRSRHASVAEYGVALDAALRQTVPGPVPDPVHRDRPEPPPPPPPPPPGPGFLSGKGKLWGGIGAAVVVFGIISVILPEDAPTPPPFVDSDRDGVEDGDDDCPAVAGLAPTGCPSVTPGPGPGPQPPPPPPFNATGMWRDQSGNQFSVQHDGRSFTGMGSVPGTGLVNIRGALTMSGASIVISTAQGVIFQGNGSVGPGSGGIDITFGSFMFHINH
jgi:serine/threonine protein kinase